MERERQTFLLSNEHGEVDSRHRHGRASSRAVVHENNLVFSFLPKTKDDNVFDMQILAKPSGHREDTISISGVKIIAVDGRELPIPIELRTTRVVHPDEPEDGMIKNFQVDLSDGPLPMLLLLEVSVDGDPVRLWFSRSTVSVPFNIK